MFFKTARKLMDWQTIVKIYQKRPKRNIKDDNTLILFIYFVMPPPDIVWRPLTRIAFGFVFELFS